MSNIVSNRYTFNAFVTALQECGQLESEISSSNVTSVATHHARCGCRTMMPPETLLVQYGRNPKFTSKGRSQSQDPAMSFEETRRKNKRYNCAGLRWRVHKYSTGTIFQPRGRLKKFFLL